MNHASLFSGIGGFDLAAREVGWNNVFQCEIDPFCQSVLKYYFPKTVLYEDIKRTDFTSWKGKIDVLTGGFPCQPFSVAGQRKGADDNRYLWPEMLRVIRETRPLWVIGENVAGITNMVQPGSETDVETKSDQDEENYKETILEQEYIINTICDDIEREGYSAQPIIIPACGVGAPHRRDRVWFIAHSNGSRGLQFGERRDIRDKEQYDQDKEPERHEQPSRFGGSGEAYVISDSDNERLSTIGITDRVSSAERWKDFPTQPPVCRGNDGLPFNVDNLTIPYGKWIKESIKTYGNAIVPQIAMKIFEIINKIEGYE
jgi:DNA (cytosine-5)-methyltransferase 1